jgi:hypothetical protein
MNLYILFPTCFFYSKRKPESDDSSENEDTLVEATAGLSSVIEGVCIFCSREATSRWPNEEVSLRDSERRAYSLELKDITSATSAT